MCPSLFDVSGVADYDFTGEDELPLGFVASVIDPNNDDFAIGPVTTPVYLEYSEDVTPPSITSSNVFDVAENGTAAGTVVADDPEGSPITYAIAGGADAAAFTIDENTGELAFADAPDFEAPSDADGDNTYEVTVSAADPTNAPVTQDVSVNVTDVDETLPMDIFLVDTDTD